MTRTWPIEATRVWSLPFNARTGQIKGEGQPLTAPGIIPIFSDLSPDGKKLVFTAGRLGSEKRELWEKSLEDGAERLLTVRDHFYEDMVPRWSRDGTRISYKRVTWNAEHTDTKFEIVILHVGSNEEQVLPLEADAIVSDWSADGRWLLGITDYQNRRHFSVCLIPVSATHAEKEMRVDFVLWAARKQISELTHGPRIAASCRHITVAVANVADGAVKPITSQRLWQIEDVAWLRDGSGIVLNAREVVILAAYVNS